MKIQITNLLACLLLLSIISCDSLDDKKGRFLLKGNEKLKENDPKAALAFYSEALELDSTYVDAYFNKALAHIQLIQLEEGIADLSLAIRYNSNYSEAYFQRGLSYLDNGEYYKARDDASTLKTLEPKLWKSYFLSGLVEEKLKNLDQALLEFQKAIELDSANSDLIVNQATIHFYKKDFGLAKSLLEKAEIINPTEANIHNLNSMILFEEGEYKLAIEAVDKAITLNNRQPYYYNNKGLYLLFLGQLEEGLELINQSIKMDPKNSYSLRNKGIYFVKKGDKISALSYLNELMENYPDMELVKEYFEKAQAM